MNGNGPAWSQLVSSCSFCDCIVHSRSGVIARRKGEGREGEKGGEGREGEGVRGEKGGDGRGRGKEGGEKEMEEREEDRSMREGGGREGGRKGDRGRWRKK